MSYIIAAAKAIETTKVRVYYLTIGHQWVVKNKIKNIGLSLCVFDNLFEAIKFVEGEKQIDLPYRYKIIKCKG